MQAPKHPYGGPVPVRATHQTPKLQAQSFELDRTNERKSTVAIAAVLMFACVAIQAIAATLILWATFHRPAVWSFTDFEQSQVAAIKEGLDGIVMDPKKSAKLRRLPKQGGREFYDHAFKHALLDLDIMGKVVSLRGGDSKPDHLVADRTANIPLAETNCSYTAPRPDELLHVMQKVGPDRTIVVTFNARNWNNYPEHGVIVAWSDSASGVWLTFEEARDEWGITEHEWADPAGKLFGKKAPFQHTYE